MNSFKLKFPHGSTPVMVKIIKFHENCMLVVIFVLIIVFILLIFNLINLFVVTNKLEKEMFEMSWTLIPTLIIISLMVPSLELLYFSEETGGMKTKNSVKIMGHQWYWTYETKKKFKDFIVFDSYLIKENELNLGEFRKCEVDHPIFFKVNEIKRLLITSADSIHSWAVPEFGVKVDAIPGRLNQIMIFTPEVGRFYGFCSELCGVNHSFMPIVVEVLNNEKK